jgi:hypothetical protein
MSLPTHPPLPPIPNDVHTWSAQNVYGNASKNQKRRRFKILLEIREELGLQNVIQIPTVRSSSHIPPTTHHPAQKQNAAVKPPQKSLSVMPSQEAHAAGDNC